jgi:hypothetical protein
MFLAIVKEFISTRATYSYMNLHSSPITADMAETGP